MAGKLELVNLTKRFGGNTVVDDLSVEIPQGSFFAMLGASGCGKTTTLRMIAGLERPDAGRIILDGDDITDRRAFKRPLNTVFQSYALFPHLTIRDNVAFGLKERKQKQIREKVDAMLRLVELEQFADRKPAQLSGGQQQRVALARALVNQPQVLLLDEPLGALDLKLRHQMQLELARIQTDLGLTFVHVTHDQEEAMTMADTIAVMNDGRIIQMGSPVELYENPRTQFVANFLGVSNLLPGRITERRSEVIVVDVNGQEVVVPVRRNLAADDRIQVGVRPEKLHVSSIGDPAPEGHNSLDGEIVGDAFTGIGTQFQVRLGSGQEIVAFAQNLSAGPRLTIGDCIRLHWDLEHTFALEQDDDAGPDAGAVQPGDLQMGTGTGS